LLVLLFPTSDALPKRPCSTANMLP